MGRIADEAARLRNEALQEEARRQREHATARRRAEEEAARQQRDAADRERKAVREVEEWAEPIVQRLRLREMLAEVRRDLWHCGRISEAVDTGSKMLWLVHRYEYVESMSESTMDGTDWWRELRVRDAHVGFSLRQGSDGRLTLAFESDQCEPRAIPNDGGYSEMQRVIIRMLANDWNVRGETPKRTQRRARRGATSHARRGSAGAIID